MARPPRIEPHADTTPGQFPEVVPPSYAETVQTGWVVESMMQVQQTLGELKAMTKHLTEESTRHGAKLDRISHIIFAAGAVLAVLMSIGGFLLDKLWDSMVLLLKGASH